jgi:hypothetical protein
MAIPERWKNPQPVPAVIDLLDAIRTAATLGQVRALAVVIVNPNLKIETAIVGDDDPIRRDILLAGLVRSTSKLVNPE